MVKRRKKEHCDFRINCISQEQASELQTKLIGLGFNIIRNSSGFTISIDLNKQKSVKFVPLIISFLKKNKIPSKSYGMWVSLSENRDHGGLTVPENVVKLFMAICSKIGGQLQFSYIFLDEKK